MAETTSSFPLDQWLATYHSLEDHIPTGYQLEEADVDNLLKFWIKI
jgi:hypothetical protein